jgi:ribosomal protein S18 acetylase RimI-like enzyme
MESTGAGKPWLVVMRSKTTPPDDLILREFQLSTDYNQVVSLWHDAGPGIHLGRTDEKEEIEKKLLRDPDLFLVAESGGRIIGTVMGGFDGRRGMVYHLAVEQAYRRMGIGNALMSELEKRMKQKGCLRTYLLVAHDNVDAIRFYESQDWELMDLRVYAKNLTQ